MPAKVAFPDFSANRAPDRAPVFVCTVRESDVGPTWVHATGDLDARATPRLEQALTLTETRRLVILDLRGLSSMDSASALVISQASARARRAGRCFVVIRGCSRVVRVLSMSRASDRLAIVELDAPEPPGRSVAAAPLPN